MPPDRFGAIYSHPTNTEIPTTSKVTIALTICSSRVNVYLRRVKTGVNVSLITNVTGSIAIAQMGSKENTAKKFKNFTSHAKTCTIAPVQA